MAKGKKKKARNKSQKAASSSISPAPKVWQPEEGMEEGEELDFDRSAYDCLLRFQDSWPSLSFDLISETSLVSGYPCSIQLVYGTQAAKLKDNYISVTRLDGISKMSKLDEGSEESESSEEDEDSTAEISFQRLLHHGGINRVRSLPQDGRFVAVWDEKGVVEIVDITTPLQAVQSKQSSKLSQSACVLHSHQHQTEGFALDWSLQKQGLLASGDCGNQLHVWMPDEGETWQIQSCTAGHEASVEDIQWSPCEESVFASCSVDKTIKIWDTRQLHGAQLTVEASLTDINVISWSRNVEYMFASGDDDGILKIWDLRKFHTKEEIAQFTFHSKSITSVEWSPAESSVLATSSDDNQIAIWDLSLERDPEEEAQFAVSKNAQLPANVPPQLLFLHAGQNHIKELHWNGQMEGMMVSTASDGFNVFKASNI